MSDLSGEDVARNARLRVEQAAQDRLVADVIALARQLPPPVPRRPVHQDWRTWDWERMFTDRLECR